MSPHPATTAPTPPPAGARTPDEPARPRPARLHGLDALRGGALLLGILLHALMPYVPGMPWLVTDAQSSTAVLPVIMTIHLFRMVTFMLLAGFFGAMVLRRRGAPSYFRDRLKRILLPMVAFWPVAVLSLGVLAIVNAEWRDLPAPPAAPPGNDPMMIVSPGQLWFLWTLMQCIVIVLVVRLLARLLLGADRTDRLVARTGRLLATPFGVLLAAAPYALGLQLQGHVRGAIVAPATLRPELPSLVTYLGAFVVGWALFTAPGTMQRLARQCWPHLGVAAVTTAVCLLTEGANDLPLPVAAALIAVAGWTWTYGLVGFCVRYLHRERPALRYLADSSYWAYLLHLPLLVAGEMLVADQTWPVGVKLIIVLGGTSIVLLVSYHLLVRSTFLGTWLNGRRYPFRLRLLPGGTAAGGRVRRRGRLPE